MNAWRVGYGVGLACFVVVPLLMPLRGLLKPATWAWTAADATRLAELSLNTLTLTAATVALALPLGIALAVLLFRTSFFARRFLLFLLTIALFIPLPMLVSSWQGLLGGARPFATGMGPAIWVHAIGALPWVAFIVGLGLTWIEPELEDEASLIVGPWRVLFLVTLPRARASILAAGLFVILQTAAEVGVTEMMLVPTLAEETRRQFALADGNGLERTLALSLPGLALTAAVVLAGLAYLEKHLPPLTPPTRVQRPLPLGPAWFRCVEAVLIVTFVLAPLFSLFWKLGLADYPSRWSLATAWHFLQTETRLLGPDLLTTLTTSLVTGFLTAALALTGCWLARDCVWLRWLLFGVLTWAWVMPGPVIGIGLHGLILLLPEGPWKVALYYGPSPAPLIWVQAIRALPIAVVFLWPVVRMIPREWFEEARLAEAGPGSEFLHVVAPLTWRATLTTALAAAALCLGEVSASARVETPGWESFTNMLLDRLHYGVDNSLAALSVLMLASLVVLVLVALGLRKLIQGRDVVG